MDMRRPSSVIALELIERSPYRFCQHAAVLSDRVGSFCWAVNYPTADGMTKHAEERAIEKANRKRLAGACLTVVGRRRKSGNWVYSKPCPRKCLPLAKRVGIEWLKFINKDGQWEIWRLVAGEYMRVR